MAGTAHVVGAGLAGLAAAVRLAEQGRRVVVHETAGHAGGRCRSMMDEGLGRSIDNGNHLILGGNDAVMTYLRTIGSADSLAGPERAEFPFLDLASGLRWTFRPGNVRFPLWLLSTSRRVPGTGPLDYLAALRLARAGASATVADCLDPGSTLFQRLWEPVSVAVLNARPDEAAAHLLWPVFRETLGRGEAACLPRIARNGLGSALVDPALAYLRGKGVDVRFNARLREVAFEGNRVASLGFGRERVDLAVEDRVILAVPPTAAEGLLPGIDVPRGSRAILNGHFLVEGARWSPSILGLVGGLAQWLFLRGDVASVTVSAADDVIDQSVEALAERLWDDVVRALGMEDAALPRHRIVKERRATFAQTPAEVARRPGARTNWENLFLAGDWTDTGLPATIEGAIRSGNAAAAAISVESVTIS